MKILLIGCGSISGRWLSAISGAEECRVCALVDTVPERAESAARKFGIRGAVISGDLRSALSKTRPEAVFNCTAPEAHFETTSTCLEAGCHVFSEKPMALNMGEAENLCRASEKAGKVLAVMQNRRFSPGISKLRKTLDAGEIGDVHTANSDFFRGARFEGFRRRMRHVLLLDMAVHTFDAARFITGADPVSVYCHEWNPSGSWFEHGASACAVFEMTGGAVYAYRGGWNSPGMNTSWLGEWRFEGTRGTILWDGEDEYRGEKLPVVNQEDARKPFRARAPSSAGPAGHSAAILDFLRRIDEGSLPATHCRDNLKTLAMVFGAIESAGKNTKIIIKGDPES